MLLVVGGLCFDRFIIDLICFSSLLSNNARMRPLGAKKHTPNNLQTMFDIINCTSLISSRNADLVKCVSSPLIQGSSMRSSTHQP